MPTQEEFDAQVEISKTRAAQENALDMLTRCARLAEKIEDDIDAEPLQPFLIYGILETVKFKIDMRTRTNMPGPRK